MRLIFLSFWAQFLKSTTWLYAWFMVPLGFALGRIRKGPKRQTQWVGLASSYKGRPIPDEAIESIECRWPFHVFDLPDEPSIGQYEPSVHDIYKRYGWHVAVWYQLAFRNVGHGWPYRWAVVGDDESLYRLGPLYYGRRTYRNWRAKELIGGQDWYNHPLAYYSVPGVWLDIDWR
jgi:hypothetical protein